MCTVYYYNSVINWFEKILNWIGPPGECHASSQYKYGRVDSKPFLQTVENNTSTIEIFHQTLDSIEEET